MQGERAQHLRHVRAMDGLHGLAAACIDVGAQRGINTGGSQMAHEQRHVRVRKRQHVVAGEDTSQTVNIQFLDQECQRHRATLLPHRTLFIAQTLRRLSAE